jgi:hypothetical protein
LPTFCAELFARWGHIENILQIDYGCVADRGEGGRIACGIPEVFEIKGGDW